MSASRPARHSIFSLAGAATVAALLGVTIVAAASTAEAAGTAASTSAPAASLGGCDSLLASVDQYFASTSAINQMIAITATVQNDGPDCLVEPQVTLSTIPNSVKLVWPKVFWKIDGSWTSATAVPGSCPTLGGDARDVCATATLPDYLPVKAGSTTMELGLEFTSWNDSNYGFASVAALYREGVEAPGFQTSWALDCATCFNTGTSVLPPGVTDGNSPPYSPPASAHGKSGAPAASSKSSTGVNTAASRVAASATIDAPPSASPQPSAALTQTTSAVPQSGQSTAAPAVDPVALATSDSAGKQHGGTLLATGVGALALVALGGTGVYFRRKRRRGEEG
ncbi:hypothetical protein [Actinospica robiniae]|uniref:hypothetical protein n=1 Tax=Actinospica robiniae TaxID=304901 RepID=UPI0012FAB134|nr:hypothetical protein [Actinospica robiniae]